MTVTKETVTKEILRAFATDSLPEAETAGVEKLIRDDPAVGKLYAQVREEEERGEHSVGAIWRRSHVSCPTLAQLGGYLMQAMDDELFDYIEFHLKTVGCSYCAANLEDQKHKQAGAAGDGAKTRRKKIVHSTAGVLKGVSES